MKRKILLVTLMLSLTACGSKDEAKPNETVVETTVAESSSIETTESEKESVNESITEETSSDTDITEEEPSDVDTVIEGNDINLDFDGAYSHKISESDLSVLDYNLSWDLGDIDIRLRSAFTDYLYYLYGAEPFYAQLDPSSNENEYIWVGTDYIMKSVNNESDKELYFKFLDDNLESDVVELIDSVKTQNESIENKRQTKLAQFHEEVGEMENMPESIKKYPLYAKCTIQVRDNLGEFRYIALNEEELDRLVDLIISSNREVVTEEVGKNVHDFEPNSGDIAYSISLSADKGAGTELNYVVSIMSGYVIGDEHIMIVENSLSNNDRESGRTLIDREEFYRANNDTLSEYILGFLLG